MEKISSECLLAVICIFWAQKEIALRYSYLVEMIHMIVEGKFLWFNNLRAVLVIISLLSKTSWDWEEDLFLLEMKDYYLLVFLRSIRTS